MPTRSKRPTKTTPRVTAQEQTRIDAHRALLRCSKRERDIQRLTRQLDRLLAASDLALLNLARDLVERSGGAVVDRERQSVVNG
jgi:hypothetical protein